jgi:hypothetical protein
LFFDFRVLSKELQMGGLPMVFLGIKRVKVEDSPMVFLRVKMMVAEDLPME